MNAVIEFTSLARKACGYAIEFYEKWGQSQETLQESVDPLAVKWRRTRREMERFTPEMIADGWKELGLFGIVNLKWRELKKETENEQVF